MAENLNMPNIYKGKQRLITQYDLDLFKKEINELIFGSISENSTSNLNEFSNSSIKIKNEILTNAIIPIDNINEESIYGNLQSGLTKEYINWNGEEEDYLIFYTDENISTVNLSSYFKIEIFDGYDKLNKSFITNLINENVNTLGFQSNILTYFIKIKISNLIKFSENEYSFKPEFKFDLQQILPSGGVFSIKITHCDGNNQKIFKTQKYLYNVGKIPFFDSYNYSIIKDQTSDNYSIFTYCSGIKYVSGGFIKLYINGIHNLNNQAAIENNVEYNYKLTNQPISGKFKNYNLNLNNFSDLSSIIYLNDNMLNIKPANLDISFKNAFGSMTSSINLSILLNSQKNLLKSNNLNEYFTDESFRILNNLEKLENNDENDNFKSWDSEENLNENDGLMIIPGSGLLYPQGNWSTFIPNNSPNYDELSELNERYFSRVFIGSEGIKIGGKFIFKGITKEDFLSDNISCMIKPDESETWYSLKHIRGIDYLFNDQLKITGILTDIQNIKDGIIVSWAYPLNLTSKNKICFKLGLKSKSILIKSISLINLNGNKEW